MESSELNRTLKEQLNSLFSLQNQLEKVTERLSKLESSKDPRTTSEWTLDNFTSKQQLEKDGVYSWIRSPTFSTHAGGYNLRLEVSLNGKDSEEGRSLGLAVQLVPGENDDQLEWPFTGSVMVHVVAKNGKYKTATIKPQLDSAFSRVAWNRPRSTMSPPIFLDTSFLKLDVLLDKFVSGDKLHFKVEFKNLLSNPKHRQESRVTLPFGLLSNSLANGNLIIRLNNEPVDSQKCLTFIHPTEISPDKNYFEIRLLNLNGDGCGAIGLSEPSNLGNGFMPGWKPGSIGFHSDDGQIFLEKGKGSAFGVVSGNLDVLGCGIYFKKQVMKISDEFYRNNTSTVRVFFTRNGARIGDYTMLHYPCEGLYPSVGFVNRGTEIEFSPPIHRHYSDFPVMPRL